MPTADESYDFFTKQFEADPEEDKAKEGDETVASEEPGETSVEADADETREVYLSVLFQYLVLKN